MRARTFLPTMGAGLLVAGLSMVAMPTASAALAPAGTISVECQTSTFPAFDWDADVQAEAVTDGSEISLSLQLSDLPGVVPVSLSGLAMDATLDVEVDGEPVELSGSGSVSITAGQPFAVPAATGTFTSDAEELNVVITKMSYNITAYQMDTVCPSGAATTSLALDPITVEEGALPTPSPTPTPTPTPSPTPSPTPTEEPPGDKEGKPAKGQVTFACVLYPAFGADNARFDYKADVTVSGARATAEDSEVSLRATFSDIPGIAPVPIVDGGMTIEVKGSVAGEAMKLTGASTVNAAPKEEVPVPTLTATVKTDADEAEVVLDTFKFDFGDMAGLHVYSECEAKNGAVGTMTIGIGELDEPTDAPAPTNSPTDPGATLPRTGGGDAMPVIGLWALALGLMGAGALVWLPRRRAEHL